VSWRQVKVTKSTNYQIKNILLMVTVFQLLSWQPLFLLLHFECGKLWYKRKKWLVSPSADTPHPIQLIANHSNLAILWKKHWKPGTACSPSIRRSKIPFFLWKFWFSRFVWGTLQQQQRFIGSTIIDQILHIKYRRKV